MRSYIVVLGLAIAACSQGATPAIIVDIAAVQGSGDSSPKVGETVMVEGIVTGDFQDGDDDSSSNLGGFFLQSESASPAGHSNAVFVLDERGPGVDVSVGDRVRVTGKVQEHFGETQLVTTDVTVTGRGRIEPVELGFPPGALTTNSDGALIADLEIYEGMLVRLPPMSVTEVRNLERFGSLRLSEGGRLYQFTNGNAPSVDGYSGHLEAIAGRSIILDDGRREQNVQPIRFLEVNGSALRNGDEATSVVGNLRYSRGSGPSGTETWRLMPVEAPDFEIRNPRPPAPTMGGNLSVASFNVLNYFTSVDHGEEVCGPRGDSGCRGADSDPELERQLAKTATALAMMDADIVGLMELENDAANKSLDDIVNALNARLGGDVYAAVQTGPIGDSSIRVGFVYKHARVRPLGDFRLLTRDIDSRFEDRRNRPALAQAFEHADGGVLTVIVNHLKSKGSDCNDAGDFNKRDGQGNCNLTRMRAAAALADWAATDPTGSGDPDVLIIGDLNAYVREDPLTALSDAGLVNLVIPPEGQAYSFVFDGQAGALDHVVATPGLAEQVVDTLEWHINADEAPVHDYNLEFGRDPGLFDANSPYRSSDHDPVIVGIDLEP